MLRQIRHFGQKAIHDNTEYLLVLFVRVGHRVECLRAPELDFRKMAFDFDSSEPCVRNSIFHGKIVID